MRCYSCDQGFKNELFFYIDCPNNHILCAKCISKSLIYKQCRLCQKSKRRPFSTHFNRIFRIHVKKVEINTEPWEFPVFKTPFSPKKTDDKSPYVPKSPEYYPTSPYVSKSPEYYPTSPYVSKSPEYHPTPPYVSKSPDYCPTSPHYHPPDSPPQSPQCHPADSPKYQTSGPIHIDIEKSASESIEEYDPEVPQIQTKSLIRDK